MKRYLHYTTLLIAFVFSSLSICAQAKAKPSKTKPSPLIGTWQLMSAVYTTKDTTMQWDTSTIRQIKVVTPKRFMFVVMQKNTDSVMAAATGKVVFKHKRDRR
jgi:hypothetical protein